MDHRKTTLWWKLLLITKKYWDGLNLPGGKIYSIGMFTPGAELQMQRSSGAMGDWKRLLWLYRQSNYAVEFCGHWHLLPRAYLVLSLYLAFPVSLYSSFSSVLSHPKSSRSGTIEHSATVVDILMFAMTSWCPRVGGFFSGRCKSWWPVLTVYPMPACTWWLLFIVDGSFWVKIILWSDWPTWNKVQKSKPQAEYTNKETEY